MKILFITLTLLLALTGCGKDYTNYAIEPDCSEVESEPRASFILACLQNANPKSDEEPEDWIRQCETMAENAYCPQKEFIKTYTSNHRLLSKKLLQTE
jgi:hypothetical protein